jgi:hypothetical protein
MPPEWMGSSSFFFFFFFFFFFLLRRVGIVQDRVVATQVSKFGNEKGINLS